MPPTERSPPLYIQNPREMELVSSNEFNVNPLHEEPLLVQISRAANYTLLDYNLLLAPINLEPAVMHDVVLTPYIREVVTGVTPISLKNVTGHLWRDPVLGTWIPLIDRSAMKILFWNVRGSIREKQSARPRTLWRSLIL